ncbi:hypothetical protein BpHYR1_038373 [Brachionus plicatilis]|uniref:Uncharacterized protein n=1 Tax=Brachionus plicatilis TaxID=10195 RepID=A0A3M7R198_BRAPC|nr:hypothetical protein BpHYR1_038373 [Brachionus plicatilis]
MYPLQWQTAATSEHTLSKVPVQLSLTKVYTSLGTSSWLALLTCFNRPWAFQNKIFFFNTNEHILSSWASSLTTHVSFC